MSPGRDPLYADDSVISLQALSIAREGRRPLVGTVMSVGLWHSPLSLYLYAVPYSLSPDPRIARLWTGAVNVIAVALVYAIGARFFSRPAGWMAALVYSVHAEGVAISRGIWNPNLGAPFVMLYIATGLMGYYQDRSWARVAHLPALSLGLQCHPAAVLLSPITVLLGLHALRHRARSWKRIVGQTMLSGALAALSLLPWAIGLYLAWQRGGAQAEIDSLPNRGLEYLVLTLYQGLGYWQANYSQVILPALVLLGSLVLVLRALKRPEGMPGLVAVLGFFLIPVVALVLNAKYRGFYLNSAFANAFLIAGASIGGLAGPKPGMKPWEWQGLIHLPGARWWLPAVVSLIAGLNLIHDFTPPEMIFGPIHSLDAHIAAIDLTRRLAADTGREALLLAARASAEPPYAWELLNYGQSSRVIWQGQSLPVPQNGALMVGFAADDSWPAVFAGGQRFDDYFRIVEVPPAASFVPDLSPPEPIRLANGIRLLGVLTAPAAAMPRAGQPWTAYLLWRVDEPAGQEFTLFAHLIDANGDKYAQVDVPGLPVGNQRQDEFALSRLDFQLGPGLPSDGPLYLRLGSYGGGEQFHVLDEAGNPLGDYGLIQFRGQAEALMTWDGLELNDLIVGNSLPQGPPLEVKATWQLIPGARPAPQIRWRLVAASGQPAFEQTTALRSAPPAATSAVFLTQQTLFRIPPDIPPGDYRLEITPVDDRGAAIVESWSAPVSISARDRRFDPPSMAHQVEATFADQLKLLGYDVRQEGKSMQLVLTWQALGQIARDYKYFVHVWHEGQVVAQADSMPGGYGYLTSWWAPHEVVSQTIPLDLGALAPGQYLLTSGIYDPATGERLPVILNDGTQSPDAWVTLQTITLH
jgi:hypothetical protein